MEGMVNPAKKRWRFLIPARRPAMPAAPRRKGHVWAICSPPIQVISPATTEKIRKVARNLSVRNTLGFTSGNSSKE